MGTGKRKRRGGGSFTGRKKLFKGSGGKKQSAAAAGRAAAVRLLNSREGGFLGMDLHYKDFQIDAKVAAATDTWELVAPTHSGTGAETPSTWSGCTQGTGQTNRIGEKYRIESFQAKVNIYAPAVGTASAPTAPISDFQYRVIFFLDTQTNGAVAPTSNGFIETLGTNDIMGNRDLEHTTRFKLIHDSGVRNFRRQNNAAYNAAAAKIWSVHQEVRTYSFYKKLKINVMCSGTSSNVSDITDNNIQCIFIYKLASLVVGEEPLLAIKARMRMRG